MHLLVVLGDGHELGVLRRAQVSHDHPQVAVPLHEGSQRARAGDLVRATEVAPKAGPGAPAPVNGKGGPGPGSVASAGPLANGKIVR